jgi:phosphate transport system permease protein
MNNSAQAVKRDRFGRAATQALAGLIIALTAAIIIFISGKGLATFTHGGINPLAFLTGTVWRPEAETPQLGILPFLIGSLSVSAIAIAIATAFGVPTALFLTQMAPRWARDMLSSTITLFAGVPSVVYGWLGLTVLVPLIRAHLGGQGFSILAGGLVLSVMILPTIVSVSADSLRTVPRELKEAALALGATRWQAVAGIVLPAALPGVMTGVILGVARAFGEALAVQMVIGNTRLIPHSPLSPGITLTSGITMDMGNTVSGSLWNNGLWSMAFVLLIVSLIFILGVKALAKRGVAQ